MNRRSFLKALACVPLLAIAPKLVRWLDGLIFRKGDKVYLCWDGIVTEILI